jgi:diadenosine tetraphosphate (Ap4A) HIT family hydrolase
MTKPKTSVFTTTIVEEGRVFAENDLAFAFPTNIPITPGHSLVVPKRVVATIDELTEAEVVAMHQLILVVKKALGEVVHAEGFNCAWNEGDGYGQSVPHVHIHIVPRTPGDVGIVAYGPREFLYRPGSRVESPIDELVDVAGAIGAVIPEEFRPRENH